MLSNSLFESFEREMNSLELYLGIFSFMVLVHCGG